MAAIDNDRIEQNAVGSMDRLPVPVFGDFVPISDQHIIETLGDIPFRIHLMGFVLPDLVE